MGNGFIRNGGIMIDKWDERFLNLAEHVAQWSKDPSTKVGAVIVRIDRTIVSVGYNGFPRGIEDSENRLRNRELKYFLVVHAEVNAVINAHEHLDGCTLYEWPPTNYAPTCNECAKLIIQSGIHRVVGWKLKYDNNRWDDPCRIARDMYLEAGIIVDML